MRIVVQVVRGIIIAFTSIAVALSGAALWGMVNPVMDGGPGSTRAVMLFSWFIGLAIGDKLVKELFSPRPRLPTHEVNSTAVYDREQQ
jgi:hypothetical protein